MSQDDDDRRLEIRVISKEQAKKEMRSANKRHRTEIKDLLSIPSDGITEVRRDDWSLLRVKIASKGDLFDPTTEDGHVFAIYKDESSGTLYLQRIDEN